MQQWRLLGFIWGLFFVGGVLGMRSYEELAGAGNFQVHTVFRSVFFHCGNVILVYSA